MVRRCCQGLPPHPNLVFTDPERLWGAAMGRPLPGTPLFLEDRAAVQLEGSGCSFVHLTNIYGAPVVFQALSEALYVNYYLI